MPHISLIDLIELQTVPTDDAVMAINISHQSTLSKSTLMAIPPEMAVTSDLWWGRPTPFCGNGYQQYHPAFVMAVLNTVNISNPTLATLQQWQIPQEIFSTGIDVRRSMTLNAMRMSTELFDYGSERVFLLAQNRLDAGQTDVVHDLLVYLMEALLDINRQFTAECALRAESIAAYLGISPAKVLLFIKPALADIKPFIKTLQSGSAGSVKRQIDLPALVTAQLELLRPHADAAEKQETYMRDVISTVLNIWEGHPSMR